MSIVYYEYYPHYQGTMTAKVVLDDTTFALLLTLMKDANADEALDELVEEITDNSKEALYGLGSVTCEEWITARKILNGINKNGYFVSQWEEGSFYFAEKDKTKEAKAALVLLESKIIDY